MDNKILLVVLPASLGQKEFGRNNFIHDFLFFDFGNLFHS